MANIQNTGCMYMHAVWYDCYAKCMYDCGMFTMSRYGSPHMPIHRQPGRYVFGSACLAFMCFSYVLLDGPVCTLWMEIRRYIGD